MLTKITFEPASADTRREPDLPQVPSICACHRNAKPSKFLVDVSGLRDHYSGVRFLPDGEG
ncbi:hypothetical protein [Streptomyces kronopolitis]